MRLALGAVLTVSELRSWAEQFGRRRRMACESLNHSESLELRDSRD